LTKYLKITCIIILFLSITKGTFGQTKSEVLGFKPFFRTIPHHDTYEYAKKTNNEIELVFSGLFLTYKYFISSQDVVSCVFYPSCSVYAIQSIQKQGLVIGTLSAFDRLTRCNGLSPENYEIQKETHLFYDPVD
jgi:putative component of membrane protein insertase Oxa1/YidC/SpoIIIJ protein YidD